VGGTGDVKPVHGGYHVKLDGMPGSAGLLFYSATTPTGTLDSTKFMSWGADKGLLVNSAGGGRQVQWGPITLARGVDDNMELYTWFKDTMEKGMEAQKKELKLIVFDAAGAPLHTWSLTGAHITSYSDSGHNAQTNEILVNTVQIEYEHAELVK
jgi:hypothetical protein